MLIHLKCEKQIKRDRRPNNEKQREKKHSRDNIELKNETALNGSAERKLNREAKAEAERKAKEKKARKSANQKKKTRKN